MAYSEQFYKEIIDNIPESIKSFFYFYSEEMNLECYDLEEFVKEVIEEKFKNYSHRESLLPIAAKVEKAKRDKYNYVISHYTDLLCLKVDNSKNPMFGFKNKSRQELVDSYGRADITYDEAVEYRIKECEKWKSSKSLLTEFNGLHYLSKSVKLACLKIDILLSFWNYVEDRYNGNPSSFYVKRILPDIPLIGMYSHTEEVYSMMSSSVSNNFGVSSTNNKKEKAEPITVYNAEGVAVKITPHDFLLKSLRSLDPDSIMVLSVVLNRINDITEFSKSKTVKLPLSVIKKEVFNYDNEYVVNKIRSILEYLSIVKIEYCKKGAEVPVSINIIARISFPEVGRNTWAEIGFSDEIASEIVGDNVYSVPKREYSKLSNPAAKILCHLMKEEQKSANRDMLDLSVSYDYDYFIGKIRFDSSSRRENCKVLEAAFNDYIKNNVIVNSFKIEDFSKITIVYLPLEIEQ